MTKQDAILWNAIRDVLGKPPLAQVGRNKGFRVREEPDKRFVLHWAGFAGDGNSWSTKKAGAT